MGTIRHARSSRVVPGHREMKLHVGRSWGESGAGTCWIILRNGRWVWDGLSPPCRGNISVCTGRRSERLRCGWCDAEFECLVHGGDGDPSTNVDTADDGGEAGRVNRGLRLSLDLEERRSMELRRYWHGRQNLSFQLTLREGDHGRVGRCNESIDRVWGFSGGLRPIAGTRGLTGQSRGGDLKIGTGSLLVGLRCLLLNVFDLCSTGTWGDQRSFQDTAM